MIGHIEVRHPYVGEVPPELIVGFESFKIDTEWQWVVVQEGKVVAQLLCAPAHGLLLMLRLTSLPTAPSNWPLLLFRKVFDECSKMGMLGFMAPLADDTKAQRRMMKMVSRMGGYLVPWSGVWAAGRLETKY